MQTENEQLPQEETNLMGDEQARPVEPPHPHDADDEGADLVSPRSDVDATIVAAVKQLETKIDALQETFAQRLDHFQAQADLAQMLHADMSKYRDEYWFKHTTSRLIDDLLRMHDRLAQTLRPETIVNMTREDLIRRIERTDKQLLKALDKQSVTLIPIELNVPFDDRVQEAVDTEPVAEDGVVEQVVVVLQDGFLYRGQLLRPQKVVVTA